MLPQPLQPVSPQPVDIDPLPPNRLRSARTFGSPSVATPRSLWCSIKVTPVQWH